ncbi:hypothetical protein C1645_806621 [Glomus cerebriforme]|uniref:Postreplication repair E3 ubiquitin-protein ligase RAD18 n=1 Tax=Glomus cerebriforme TaxID=658196 RepID=A0A397SY44_9GLOM|nr:hypothetical protein C1645_806621 [Glomus cerebriforme]
MQYSASTTPLRSPYMSSSTSALHLRVDFVSEVAHCHINSPQHITRQVDTECALSELESELKCSVCKDFYDVPMSSKCQHTFCAECAKFDYNNKKTGLCCPTCGYSFTSFTQFYKNTLIEDLIKEYKSNRESIAHLYALGKQAEERECREEKEGSIKATNSNSNCNFNSSPFGGTTKSKCASEKSIHKNDNDGNGQKRKRTDDNDNKLLPLNKNIRTSNNQLCKKPKIAYGLMNEKKLKNLLKEEGLPAYGSKNEMIARHSYFINLYNSNVDATIPKSKGELLRDMKKWERAHQSNEAKDANLIKKTLTNSEEINSYVISPNKYRNQFAELIQQAKINKRRRETA